MKIYYKIWTSGNHDEADPIAVGLAAENGLCAYAECNDFSRDKIDKATDRDIVSDLLGKKGMESMITSRKKTKGLIAPSWRVEEFIHAYLSPYKDLVLIGRPDRSELNQLLDYIKIEKVAGFFTLTGLSDDFVNSYGALFDRVADDLPEGNALRWALTYKHILLKHEHQKKAGHK